MGADEIVMDGLDLLTLEFWIIYHIVIAIFIAIDLWVAMRREELTFRDATLWSIIWIVVGVAWGGIVYMLMGLEALGLYMAAYLIEKLLSMDNLFVFAIIFSYFAVEAKIQPLVLYIGIITAVIFRALFIYGGILIIEMFHFSIVIFGAILLYSGYKLTKERHVSIDPGRNPVVKMARRFIPITGRYYGSKFVVRNEDKLLFTPLILVLITIETTDIIFAVDSIPAVLAITTNFFIAYTSNISAVLGLRALYSLISLTVLKFRYVSKGLSIILIYLGAKMILSGLEIYTIPTSISVAIVMSILIGSVVLSLLKGNGSSQSHKTI